MNSPIWIDLDNAPHVHFFAPLIRELEMRGVRTHVSLRSFGQTEGLARMYGMKFEAIGEHGEHKAHFSRVRETLHRAARLAAFAFAHRPALAVSHGSRSQTLAASGLGIPSLVMYDYEHISADVFHRLATRVLVPDLVLAGKDRNNRVGYPGFKEDVYVHDFRADDAVLRQLNLDQRRLVITIRPPATWAHYHNEHSTELFRALIERLQHTDAQCVLLTRTCAQAEELQRTLSLDPSRFIVTARAVDGLSLLYHSDAVFSGGGTMVREAALLGVPAYSTFAGKTGAVDRELEHLGKLTILHSKQDISALNFVKRRPTIARKPMNQTREFIVRQILDLASRR